MTANQIQREGMRRDRIIIMRVDEETKQLMRRVASERRQSIARAAVELFRQADGQQVREQEERDSPTVEELRRIRSEIWHIGHNINQIARLTNTELGAMHEDVTTIRNQVDRCERIIAGIDRIISSGLRDDEDQADRIGKPKPGVGRSPGASTAYARDMQ